MYDRTDPRARLQSAATAGGGPVTGYAGADYVKLYEIDPQEAEGAARTWYARGQNMIVAYTDAAAGAVLERKAQPDEYVILLPDHAARMAVTTGDAEVSVSGFSLTIVPPGDSSVRMETAGRIMRLFSVRSADLAAKCANAGSYATPHPNVALLEPWPAPPAGYRIRSYRLDVPPREGRFGRIFRCTTFMVNYLDPAHGPRDTTKLSPHSHEDFEQCSFAMDGEFMHHLRWPWTTNLSHWREDEHVLCGSPSVTIIPPPSIHTTRAVGPGTNQLIDIFCPPRLDFSKMEGWVLNADEYPMPGPDPRRG